MLKYMRMVTNSFAMANTKTCTNTTAAPLGMFNSNANISPALIEIILIAMAIRAMVFKATSK